MVNLLVTASSSQESLQLPETQKSPAEKYYTVLWSYFYLIGWNSRFSVRNPVTPQLYVLLQMLLNLLSTKNLYTKVDFPNCGGHHNLYKYYFILN